MTRHPFESKDNYLELLGAYNPSTYFRAVYTRFTEDDIIRIAKQSKTGKPAFRQHDYEKAAWKEKEHMLQVLTVPLHEAFHYFQNQITSYCIIDQYVRTLRNTYLLEALVRNKGLPGVTLSEFVSANETTFSKTHLSREGLLISAIMDGTRLYATKSPRPFGRLFKLIEITIGEVELPQVCIELHGNFYPLGGEALIESWAYNAMKVLVLLAFGKGAAADYAKKMNIPFYPYKVLDWVIQEVYPKTSASIDTLFVPFMASFLAFYGLSGGPFDPASLSIHGGCLPGFRAAALAERLGKYGKDSHAGIFDACEHAMMLDKAMNWSPFLINAYSTFDLISSFMSKATGHGKWHLRSVNLAPFAWFLGHIATTVPESLLDTGIIFDAREWLREYKRGKFLRPPISLFHRSTKGKEAPDMRSMITNDKEWAAYAIWYLWGSIIGQKLVSSTFECPLSKGGHSACPDFDDTICKVKLSSFDIPRHMAEKNCFLVEMLQSIKVSEKRW